MAFQVRNSFADADMPDAGVQLHPPPVVPEGEQPLLGCPQPKQHGDDAAGRAIAHVPDLVLVLLADVVEGDPAASEPRGSGEHRRQSVRVVGDRVAVASGAEPAEVQQSDRAAEHAGAAETVATQV